jgi:hypothetical protein
MQHTAIIGTGLPLVDITFNCADPANSVTGKFTTGETTANDNCTLQFVSATVAGVTIAIGATAAVSIGGVQAHATVSADDQGRHITVEVDMD